MANTTPVLIVSDAVSSPTGLGRIAREIALRAHANLGDICRIATLGYGGPGSRKLNFFQYHIEGMGADFVIPNLPEVWDDWAGKEAGIILFVWDATRLGWFARPRVMCENPVLREFLISAKIKRWIYAPLDGGGPHNRLSYPIVQSLLGFDRILAYGQWGEDLMRGSLGEEASDGRDLASIPHGIDSQVFCPRNRINARLNFYRYTGAGTLRGIQTAILADDILIGTVATNQERKDWGLWAKACSLFLQRHPKARFWIHTDKMEKDWSIPALLIDCGLIDRTLISTGYLEDDKMAHLYSACDLTLGIGPEGFGFPIFESLFCGTPCITGSYGGAREHLNADLIIDPVAYREWGPNTICRPVYQAEPWASRMELLTAKRSESPLYDYKPIHLDWANVWPQFEAWFRKGLA